MVTATAPVKKAATRVYTVAEVTVATEGGLAVVTAIRLVKAATPAQALKHVVTPRFQVSVAKMDDIIALIEDGAKVEIATTEE